MADWISVEDHLPDEEVGVLTYAFGPRNAFLRDGKWLACWDHRQLQNVTHWMALPTPPVQTGQ